MRDNNDQQQFEHDQQQQWLADPVAQAEYKKWLDSQEEGRRAALLMRHTKENQNEFNCK